MPLHIADIHMEELSKFAEQDMGNLSQEEMEAMFQPFLNALTMTTQRAIFKRIIEKVFHALIESEGIEQEGKFTHFDIIPYAEGPMFEAAS